MRRAHRHGASKRGAALHALAGFEVLEVLDLGGLIRQLVVVRHCCRRWVRCARAGNGERRRCGK